LNARPITVQQTYYKPTVQTAMLKLIEAHIAWWHLINLKTAKATKVCKFELLAILTRKQYCSFNQILN